MEAHLTGILRTAQEQAYMLSLGLFVPLLFGMLVALGSPKLTRARARLVATETLKSFVAVALFLSVIIVGVYIASDLLGYRGPPG